MKASIRKTVAEIASSRDRDSGVGGDKVATGEKQVTNSRNELAKGKGDMNRGDLGTPIVSVPSIETHGTHGTSRTPGSHESRESHESRTTPESLESHESDQDLVPAKDIVMVSYPLADGTPFYFAAQKQDVQSHSTGSLSAADLIARSGHLPPLDDELERIMEMVIVEWCWVAKWPS